jgi:DNA-binding NtrC family response regulator
MSKERDAANALKNLAETGKCCDRIDWIDRTFADMEREIILKVLDENWANRTRTAQVLDLSVRTLRAKLAVYRKQGFQIPGKPIESEEVPKKPGPIDE